MTIWFMEKYLGLQKANHQYNCMYYKTFNDANTRIVSNDLIYFEEGDLFQILEISGIQNGSIIAMQVLTKQKLCWILLCSGHDAFNGKIPTWFGPCRL